MTVLGFFRAGVATFFCAFTPVSIGLALPLDSCARSGLEQSTPSDEFTLLGDGSVVRHEATGLAWQRCSVGQTWNGSTCQGAPSMFDWGSALARAEGEGDDWRLPNIKELGSIVERCRTSPAINRVVFPNTPPEFFWTSTPSRFEGSVWVFDFELGFTGIRSGIPEPAGRHWPLRLVRGGVVPVSLGISPQQLDDGQVDTEYSFTFTARRLQLNESTVTFHYSFGVGAAGTGQRTATVTNGSATVSATHTYSAPGGYGLVVDVRDGSGNILADQTALVIIGDADEREYDLTVCDTWRAADSGGAGVTSDVWDISAVPSGAVFDIEYDAKSIPDRYIVEYPDGNTVLDTGWRGATSSYNENPALYPGGLSGPGQGSVSAMFSKSGFNSFKVTVIGPDSRTAWDYSIRCRIN